MCCFCSILFFWKNDSVKFMNFGVKKIKLPKLSQKISIYNRHYEVYNYIFCNWKLQVISYLMILFITHLLFNLIIIGWPWVCINILLYGCCIPPTLFSSSGTLTLRGMPYPNQCIWVEIPLRIVLYVFTCEE